MTAYYLTSIRNTFDLQRSLAEGAFAQVDDDAFRRPLDVNTNSIAVILKHVGGNLRSRFTNFLTSDGEKPDRDRDSEFVDSFAPGAQGRAEAIAQWNAGFAVLFASIEGLAEDDLGRTVTIRGEPHSVPLSLARALGHVSYHVGQIVMIARIHAGDHWSTLTIPRGGSEDRNRQMGYTPRG